MIKAIDRYLLRQILPTIAVILFIAAIILLMERLMRLLDIAVGNGVSTLVVFQMLFYLIPYYIGLALPIALFLGVLLAFRKLSSQSELDAIHSCGIGMSRFIRSAVLLALLMTGLNLVLTGYVQPYTRYLFRAVMFNITSGVIEQGIGEGVFMNLPNGYTLRVEQSRGGGRELYGVFAHKQEDDGHIITLTAKRGELMTGRMDGTVSLRLYEGNRSEWNPETQAAATLEFEVFDWPLNLADLVRFRGRGGDERELTLLELMRGYRANVSAGRHGIVAHVPPPPDTLPPGTTPEAALPPDALPEDAVAPSAVAAEFHGRVVFSLSMLLLPILAAPLGIMTSRASRSFGLVFGLLILVSYHKVLEFTGAYAASTGAPAGLILWSAFGVFAVGTIYLFRVTERQAGTPPVLRMEAHWVAFIDRIIAVFRPKRASSGAR
jgi:lipopolysaccharide export system permease protein